MRRNVEEEDEEEDDDLRRASPQRSPNVKSRFLNHKKSRTGNSHQTTKKSK